MVKRIVPEPADHLVRLHVAEPSPLGLFGLSLGCMLLFSIDFEATEGTLLSIPWIIFMPGLCQFIAGMADFARHNIFGATAFTGYSMFWFGLATSLILEQYADTDKLPSPTRQHTGVMCIGFLVFSLALTVISLAVNKTFLTVLFCIDFAFFFLLMHIFEEWSNKIVGVFLVGVCVSSIYGFVAVLLLKMAGGEVLPLGKPVISLKDYILDEAYQSHSHINNPNHKKTDSGPSSSHGSHGSSHVSQASHNDNLATAPAAGQSDSQIKTRLSTSVQKKAGSTPKGSPKQYMKVRRSSGDVAAKETEKLELVTQE